MSDVNYAQSRRQALKTAILEGKIQEVKRLLDFNDIQTKVLRRKLLNYSLGISCEYGQAECVRMVLGLDAQVDVKCEESKFLPLFYATRLPADKALEAKDIIAQLVHAGADLDARDQDHNGSNALMWAKTKDAAQALLNHAEEATRNAKLRGSYINRKDNDGKTALMWSVITPTDTAVSTFLKDNGSDMLLTDDQGSTVLHWAARSNKCEFANVLLKAGIKSSITNLGGRTPLHLAVGSNNLEVVQLLLAQDADDVKSGSKSALDVKSAGGWLPLHVACGAFEVQPTLAWELIRRSEAKHLLQPTSTGKTAVIIAADRGNIAVVEQLQIRIRQIQSDLENEHATLQQRMDSGSLVDDELSANRNLYASLLSARGMRDNDGNIALFNAGICESSIAREFLAPWNLDDAVRDISTTIPAKQFQAKVVDLLVEPRKIDVGRASVFDLIYTNPELSHSVNRRTLPRKECTYRWIHLPANKRSWCRDLFQKYYIELWHAGRINQGEHADIHPSSDDIEHDESKTANNHDDSEATDSRGTYTIEHFRKVSRTLAMQRIGHTTHSAYMTPRCRPILPVHDLKFGNRRFSEPTFIDDEHNNDEYFTSEPSPVDVSHGQRARGDCQQSNDNGEETTELPSSLFLYMPYLHFEYYTDLHKMKEVLKYDPTQIKEPKRDRKPGFQGPYSQLLFTGLHGEARDYHQRRTLDQFFYRNITTDERDKDQVAYRYQRSAGLNGERTTNFECKIIMVDELWMWIVNDEFIVTSFPERWNQTTKSEFDVWENVLDKITAKGPDKSVPTVYHLAALISDTCSKAFNLCDIGKPRFIDMFEGSLGKAMDDTMGASRRLTQASVQGSKWLRSVSEEAGDEQPFRANSSIDSDFISLDRIDADVRASVASANDQDEDSMEFVDSLLDLKSETNLVYEITDTRDELEILSMVLTWQKRILQELRNALPATDPGDVKGTHHPCRRPIQFIESSLRTVTTTMSDLKRMEKQAERIYATITTILDIKQKYANAIEARSVRAGGVTIMVFTVATVFFLPASFIISFFGLSLESLPHQGDNISLSPGLVCGWVLGLGVGVALVYLAVAFRVRTINRVLRWIKRKWRASNNSNMGPPREIKKAMSRVSTSRVNTDISYAGTQRRKTSSMDGKEEV